MTQITEEEIAKCIGRAVAAYAFKAGIFYHNDEKYAKNVPYTCIETEAKMILSKINNFSKEHAIS